MNILICAKSYFAESITKDEIMVDEIAYLGMKERVKAFKCTSDIYRGWS